MKNKNILILLAIAAGYYFVYGKKKKKGTVSVENFLPLQGNEAELAKQEGFIYPGELAKIPVNKIKEIPAVKNTIDKIKNSIFTKATAQVKAVENKIVKQVQAKKTEAKKTQAKKTQAKKTQAKKTQPKTRAQKLGELGALYL
jgi:hypothetical protein